MADQTAPSNWRTTRAKIANRKRSDPEADVSDLRLQLKAERLEDHIRRTVNAAPKLTPAMRDRLAILLRP